MTISAWLKESSARPTVALSDIELNKGIWNTTDINLVFRNCRLLVLWVKQSVMKKTGHILLNVSLYNSSLGQLEASNIYLEVYKSSCIGSTAGVTMFYVDKSKVAISNSSFKNIHTTKESAILFALNSHVTIKHSVFDSNHGPDGAVFGYRSNIMIVDSVFNNNRGINAAAVTVQDIGSILVTQDTNFTNNRDAFAVSGLNYVTVKLNNCYFHGNNAPVAAAIYVQVRSTLIVQKSIFIGNRAANGSTIIAQNDASVYIAASHFGENIAENIGGIYFGLGSRMTVVNSTFRHNIARLTGSAIQAAGDASLYVEGCHFEENEALQGGAIKIQFNVSTKIMNCSFRKNQAKHNLKERSFIKYQLGTWDVMNNNLFKGLIWAQTLQPFKTKQSNNKSNYVSLGGAILASYNVTLFIESSTFTENVAEDIAAVIIATGGIVMKIQNSIFVNNSASQTGVIQVEFGSSLEMINSNFTLNSGTGLGTGVLLGTDYSSLIIVNSYFRKNSAHESGVIAIQENTKLMVMDSHFISNKAMETCGVLSASASKVECSDCIFYDNEAQWESVYYLINSSLKSYNSQYLNHFSNMITLRKNSELSLDNCSIANDIRVRQKKRQSTESGDSISLIIGQDKSKVELTDTEIKSIEAYILIDLETSSSLLARNSMFRNNTVGSAIGLRHSSRAELDFCKVLNNKASGSGSVISSYGGQVLISNSIIHGNSAAGSGGAIYANMENVIVLNTTFMQNQAFGNGGAICIIGNIKRNNFFKAVNVQFLDNQGGIGGAAIFIQRPVDVVLDSCIFSNNKGHSDLGISFEDIKDLRMSKCNIHDTRKEESVLPSIYFTRSLDCLDTNFMTYQLAFSSMNHSLFSSDKNFMKQAVKLGFISIFDAATVLNYTINHYESKYSSGKR